MPRYIIPIWPLLAILGATRLAALGEPVIDGCAIFPLDNIWNVPVASLPVDSNSTNFINTIGPNTGVHPDFGSGLYMGEPIGIPYNSVLNSQTMVPIVFDQSDESDAGPYPIPPNPLIEGGPASTGDRHILVLRQGSCILYETDATYPDGQGGCVEPGGWCAYSGAIFPLTSDLLRTATWTSADAAGLPMLPGLARYAEVAASEIRHALRFTTEPTQTSFRWPARHQAGSTGDPNTPPMGLRVRLKASYDISGFSPAVKVILTALKRYGMMVADNGGDWFISGEPNAGWDNDTLVSELSQVKGNNFEVVDVSSLMLNPDSGATPHLFSDGFDSGTTQFWSATQP